MGKLIALERPLFSEHTVQDGNEEENFLSAEVHKGEKADHGQCYVDEAVKTR